MRRDMSKVIVERPRRRGWDTHGRGRAQDPDLQVSHEGMRAPYVRHWGGKELNENLAPLLRFLGSRVGRVWNDVFSEICENIRLTSTVQKHVRDHIAHMVATRVWIDDAGNPWNMESSPRELSQQPYIKYWVDPRDGILRHNTALTYRQRQQLKQDQDTAQWATHSRSLPGGIELRLSRGIWYQVSIENIPEFTQRQYTSANGTVQSWETGGSAYDVILETQVQRSRYRGGLTTYCASKRQLSGAELRRYGVENQ